MTDPEYFDLGAERPTQPREPDISERDLDALRAKWRAEIERAAMEYEWWETVLEEIDGRISAACALSALMCSAPKSARTSLDSVIDRELEKREREELSHE